MDFKTFMRLKSTFVQNVDGDVIDLTNCSMVDALQPWRPAPPELVLPANAHRCHLAEHWLNVFGLPPEWKKQALVCKGVRHSLGLLCKGWAETNSKVLMPYDVYPVYLETAQSAGVTLETYQTWPTTPDVYPDADVLLITNPLKPRGTSLTTPELDAVKTWLAKDASRRVVVDAVYTFSTHLDQSTLTLFETGQAIVLHSLSKGWAYPLVMGVALVPTSDVERWAPMFRADGPALPQLCLAEALLTQAPHTPESFSRVLTLGQLELEALCSIKGVPLLKGQAGLARYHFLVPMEWMELLITTGVLGMPLSIFGSNKPEVSVITSLPLLNP